MSRSAKENHTLLSGRLGCGLAIVGAGLALLVRLVLVRWLGPYQPSAVFYLAVLLVGWGAGWRPALLTAGLGLVAEVWLLLLSQARGPINPAIPWVHLLIFSAVSLTVVLLLRLTRRERQLSEALIHSLPGLVYVFDSTGRLQRWNPRVEQITGHTAEQIRQMCVTDFVLPADRPAAWEAIRRAMVCGEDQVEVRVLDRQGRPIPFWCNGRRFASDQGPWLVGMAMDITARKQAEAALQQSEERFRQIAETIHHVFWVVEPHPERVLYVSPAFERLWGRSAAEIYANPRVWMEPIHPEDQPKVQRVFDAWLEAPETHPYDVEYRLVKPGQKLRWISDRGTVIRGAGGEVSRLTGVAEDITQRKEALLQLEEHSGRIADLARRHEEALALVDSLLRHAPVGFAFFDRAHRFVRINTFLAHKINGLPIETHLGRRLAEVLPRIARPVEPILDLVFETGRPVENLEVTGETPSAPGVQRHWLAGMYPVGTEAAIQSVGVVVMEITEQKRIEAALRQGEEALQQQTRLLRDQNLRLRLLNEAATPLMGTEGLNQMVAAVFERIAGPFQVDAFAVYRLSDDGQHLELDSSGGLSPEVQEQIRCLDCRRNICGVAARERRPITIAHLQSSTEPGLALLKALGLRAYHVSPLFVGERLIGTLAFGSRSRESFSPEDVEFFQALASYQALAKERVRLTEALRQHAASLEQTVDERTAKLQELLAELEHMSYSIMHDMRAPLRAIMGFAQMIERADGTRLSAPSREFLASMKQATERMDNLILDALHYSRAVRQELPLGPVDVGELLRGILRSYPEFQPPQAEVRLEGEFPRLWANRSGLTQCFSNLLSNAIKFVKPGQKAKVRIWAQEVRHADCGLRSEPIGPGLPDSALPTPHAACVPPHSARVRLCFEDQGVGIPAGGEQRIFDMFQRLHAADYPGTGIGLALVRKVVERMGGRVGVESQEGQGSCFWVELRRAD